MPEMFLHQDNNQPVQCNQISSVNLHLNLSFSETSQCHPNPCENGGTCRDEDAVDSHQPDWWCECQKGYSGRRCHGMFLLNAEIDDYPM